MEFLPVTTKARQVTERFGRFPNPLQDAQGAAARLTVVVYSLLMVGCASSSPAPRSSLVGIPPTSPAPASTPRGAPWVQRGKATFYGGRYHGRLTANGETFDKNSLTAAHRDLPFGLRVLVTNLENGKSVIVRINDRFQPIKGRIIDLSEGAFRRLAPLSQGVIPVQIQPAPPNVP